MQINKHYYLYRHTRIDNGEVFYIGIGTTRSKKNYKYNYERAFTKNKRSKHWLNIVNKTDYTIDIIFKSDDYNIIKKKEKRLIKLYGRKDLNLGSLVNHTDGGEGTLNHIVSNYARQKSRERIIEMNKSRKFFKRISTKRLKKGRGKKVIDLETGIFYDKIKEACYAKDVKYSISYVSMMLNGKEVNKTNFKLI